MKPRSPTRKHSTLDVSPDYVYLICLLNTYYFGFNIISIRREAHLL